MRKKQVYCPWFWYASSSTRSFGWGIKILKINISSFPSLNSFILYVIKQKYRQTLGLGLEDRNRQ